MVEGILLAAETDGLVPEGGSDTVELSVSVRGVPVGLVHTFGAEDDESLMAEAGVVSRLSHGGVSQRFLTFAVAKAVRAAALDNVNPLDALRSGLLDIPHGNELLTSVDEAFDASIFEDAVFAAVNAGGPTDTTGALAGAIAGARFGASGIPQALIDQLDARIYLSLAAPWFFRTAKRRAGTVIDLRLLG